MNEKKKLIFVIGIGLVVLFFMHNNFYLPALRDNAKLYKEYKELRKNVRGLEEFSEANIATRKEKMEELITDLDSKIPPAEKRIDLTEQVTHTPEEFNISFAEINRRGPQQQEGYQVSSVDLRIKSALFDFLKYLEEIDKGPLLIAADNVNIRKGAELEPGLLNISLSLSGYQITKKPALPQEYLAGSFVSLPLNRIERILEPLRIEKKPLDLSRLKIQDPFGVKVVLQPPKKVEETVIPAREEEMPPLILRGITQIGDKKAALINEKVVKIGAEIEGMEVVEIHRFSVVLAKAGKKYILKLGRKAGK